MQTWERAGGAARQIDTSMASPLLVSPLAVVELSRWARYALVSRRIEGGRAPLEASSSVMAGGRKQPAITEQGPAIIVFSADLRLN
jgi:hypothetical protein